MGVEGCRIDPDAYPHELVHEDHTGTSLAGLNLDHSVPSFLRAGV
jgi:hypothetical protein